jgi:carbohydrate-binding DOMON domain-containing protein
VLFVTSTSTATETQTQTQTETVTETVTATEGAAGGGGVERFGQCGGSGYVGPTTCYPPYKCVAHNEFYWQCE